MAYFSCVDELDEEKAKRSILVTNLPLNISDKDVIIHFQKTSNGGGEVDGAMFVDPEDRSVAVVTFDEPMIVETAIDHQHNIIGTVVTVQRYPVEALPEIFTLVDARINSEIFEVMPDNCSIERLLDLLKRNCGVKSCQGSYGYVLSGSYPQIKSCHARIHEIMAAGQRRAKPPPTDKNTANMGASDAFVDEESENEIKEVKFQSVPIILQFIFNVEKYSQQIEQIERKRSVKIYGDERDTKVVIKPSQRCTQKEFDIACEEFIKLYQDIYTAPMVSKEVVLKPGLSSSFLTTEKAVKEVLQDYPLAVEEINQDTWLFYGDDRTVRNAIKRICKSLDIPNPCRPMRKSVKNKDESHGNVSSTDHGTPAPGEALGKTKQEPISSHGNDPNMMSGGRMEVVTKKGYTLSVYHGDITDERVDVIVNPSDEYQSTALSAALAKKGGPALAAEVLAKVKKVKPGDIISTGGGSLTCSKILHVLLPASKYKSKKKDEYKKAVEESCSSCLKLTEKTRFASIAFPVVGGGLGGMPVPLCATAMLNAVEQHMTAHGGVSDIRFVHVDLAAVQVFQDELKKRYGDTIKKSPDDRQTARSAERPEPTPGRAKATTDAEDDCCPICLDKFSDPVELPKCKHKFCKECIDNAFKHRKSCPTCLMVYGVQTGNMPRGTMKDRRNPYTRLSGYERYGSIEIIYDFPSGIQGPEHPQPGQRYSGTSRTAYLPDCPEGRKVLALLRKAFDARLTFTIGTSVTTGADNQVTWNDIHHKTNPYGGSTGFGYPDPDYLRRVKEELAAKGVS